MSHTFTHSFPIIVHEFTYIIRIDTHRFVSDLIAFDWFGFVITSAHLRTFKNHPTKSEQRNEFAPY